MLSPKMEDWKKNEEVVLKMNEQAKKLHRGLKYNKHIDLCKKAINMWGGFLETVKFDFTKKQNRLLSDLHYQQSCSHLKLYEQGKKYYSVGEKKYCQLEMALAAISKSILADPMWELPFMERSLVFQQLKELFDTGHGVNSRSIVAEEKKSADIVVDAKQQESKVCSKEGKMSYKSLKDALDECKDGNKIFIEDGIYGGDNRQETTFVIWNNISLIGASTTKTIIHGYIILNNDISLKRLRFQQPGKKAAIAISVAKGLLHIKECYFSSHLIADETEDQPGNYTPIYINPGDPRNQISMNLQKCIFFKCNSLELRGKYQFTIQDCYFKDCTGSNIIDKESVMTLKDSEVHGHLRFESTLKSTLNVYSSYLHVDLKKVVIDFDNLQLAHPLIDTAMRDESTSGLKYFNSGKGEVWNSCFRHHYTAITVKDTSALIQRNFIKANENPDIAQVNWACGLNILRKTRKVKVKYNKFDENNASIIMADGAAPHIYKNHFVIGGPSLIMHSTSKPHIEKNTFEGHQERLCVIQYNNGSGGLCNDNRFVNASCHVIHVFKDCNPRLVNNKYENVHKKYLADEEFIPNYAWISSEKDELEMAATFEGRETPEEIRHCVNCEFAKKASKCKRCLQVYYCSPECQQEHWPRHKSGCDREAALLQNLRYTGCTPR